jgi:predicted ATPase
MKRYILTGAPGAGKTAILRALEVAGHVVVEEAATDIIALEQARGRAEPWREPDFIDAIAELQRRRQLGAAGMSCDIQVFDRSPVCTLALARFLGFPVSAALRRELERIDGQAIYERQVFFIENLGFMTNTEARRISLDDAVLFGRVHEDAYRELGYDLVRVAPGTVEARAAAILRGVAALPSAAH